MNYEELANVVNTFYNNSKLASVKLETLSKEKNNRKRAKELTSIRIEFKHVHMSGKENLDIMLKKAYLFDFQIVTKEQTQIAEITELNKLISLLDTQITKLSGLNDLNPEIEKKKKQRDILQKQYEKVLDSQPKEENINLNGTAMKILKMLEKDNDESRKIHNIIKFRVCGTTALDDVNIRRENLKYLTGTAREEEEKKIDQIEANIKNREQLRNNKGIRSSRSTSQLGYGSGYVLPHLRQKEGSLSMTNISHISENVVTNQEEDYPELSLNQSKSSISVTSIDSEYTTNVLNTPKEKKNSLSGWGSKKSFVDLIKETLPDEIKNTVKSTNNLENVQTLSSTIEIINDTKESHKTHSNEQQNIEIDDWTIE